MNKCPWCGSETESGHTEVSGIGSDCLTLDIWYTYCTSDNCGYYSVSDNPEKTLAVAAMNIANILDVISEDDEAMELDDVKDTAYNAALDWAADWIIGAQLSSHGVEVQRYANTMAMSIRAAKRGLTPRPAHAACTCGSKEFYTDKVLGVVCCRCQAPRQ